LGTRGGEPSAIRKLRLDWARDRQRNVDVEQQRLRLVAEASRVLGATLDDDKAIDWLASLAVATLCHWCVIFMRKGEEPRVTRGALACADPNAIESALGLPIVLPLMRGGGPLSEAILTGASQRVPDFGQMIARAALDPEHSRFLRHSEITSALVVPLGARGRVIGAMILAERADRGLLSAERMLLAEDLAHVAAIAIDNAQLHRAEREARLELQGTLAKLRHEKEALRASLSRPTGGDPSDASARSRERGSATVLVVEDDAEVADFVRYVLDSHGYRVITVGDGEAALALVERAGEPIDLVLSDLVLPRMNGRDVTTQLVRICPSLRVLHMSGYPGDLVDRPGELGPRVAFLPKPFTAEMLARKVCEVLELPPPGVY
jgi:CheY-like chemotaxis protein